MSRFFFFLFLCPDKLFLYYDEKTASDLFASGCIQYYIS